MIKYNIIKAICILTVLAAALFSGYMVYSNIMQYHAQSITRYDTGGTQPSPAADIELAVLRSGAKGSPYNIRGLLAFYQSYEDNSLIIKLVNINDLDIKLVTIHDEKYDTQYPVESNDYLKATGANIEYIDITIDNVDAGFVSDMSDMYIDYMYDDGVKWTTNISPFTMLDFSQYNSTEIRTKNNIDEFDFVSVSGDIISFEGNDVRITKPMYIPSYYTLVINAGQSIDLINSAYIISYSPITSIGSETDAISFYSSDGTGRGIYICKASKTSTIHYTSFSNLDTPGSGIWGLTGSVTFYESDVDISNCSFTNNNCEDALNIICGEFTIDNCIFSNIYSDAFDADFSTGSITDCTFFLTGNDAIDVSASIIDIAHINFIDIGDKAVSCGENSALTLNDINIKNAVIGIASKDMSQISGSDIDISDTTIGMTLYQKKPEFGPAQIDVSDVNLHSYIGIDYLIQKDSIMKVDGSRIYPRSDTKEGILFDKMINGEPIQ